MVLGVMTQEKLDQNSFEPKGKDHARRFCASFTSLVAIVIVFSTLLGTIIIGYFLERDLSISYAEAVRNIFEVNKILPLSLVYSALFQFLFAITAIAISAIIYSHKVVGPIFRFKIIFREIARGRMGAIYRIRHNDQLKTSLEYINHMMIGIFGNLEFFDSKSRGMELLLEKLESSSDSEKDKILQDLKKEIASFADRASIIKIGHDL